MKGIGMLFPFVLAAAAAASDSTTLVTKAIDPNVLRVPAAISDEHTWVYFPLPVIQLGGACRLAAGPSGRPEWDTALGFPEDADLRCADLAAQLSAGQGFEYRQVSMLLHGLPQIKPGFADLVQHRYGAVTQKVDFGSSAEIARINESVFSACGLKDIVQPDPRRRAMLLAAARLKALWANKAEDAGHGVFDGVEGRQEVDYLATRFDSFYALSYNCRPAYVFPLQGGLQLWIIQTDSKAELQKIAQEFAGIVSGEAKPGYSGFSGTVKVEKAHHLVFPAGEITSDIDLIALYRKLGVSRSFGLEADFRNMSSQGLFIDAGRLQSRLVLNKEGIEGGQAAYFSFKPKALFVPEPAAPPQIKLNGPFVGLVVHAQTGAPLCIWSAGSVKNGSK